MIMSLPEAVDPEFLLLQPMIPKDRPNMIAWVAARNDGDDYGKTLVYRFPTETSVFGPAQIEAQIDADPEISAQFTLWSQSGSNVIRGNLIVVPVGESLDLPPAGLSPGDERQVPGLPEDHRRVADDRRLGRHAPAGTRLSYFATRAVAPARRHRRRPPGPTPTPGADRHAEPGPDAPVGRR